MKLCRPMQVYVQLVFAMLLYGVSFVSTKIVLVAFGPVTVLAIRLILSSAFLVLLDRLVPVVAGARSRLPAPPAPGLPATPREPTATTAAGIPEAAGARSRLPAPPAPGVPASPTGAVGVPSTAPASVGDGASPAASVFPLGAGGVPSTAPTLLGTGAAGDTSALPAPAGAPTPAIRKWPALADLRPIIIVTLFQPILYFLSETVGLQFVSASIASIIIATIPVFTPFVAGPFLGERIGVWGVVGLALSLGGVAIIVLERKLEMQFTPPGLVLIFVAVLAAVGYSVAVRRTPTRYRPLTLVKMQSLFGLPIILIIALATEGLPRQLPPTEVIVHLVYLGIFPSSIAFVLYSAGIRALGASRANVFTNLVPGFTALFAWLLIGEVFTLQKVAGMAVVIAGVLAAQRGSRIRATRDLRGQASQL